MGKHKRRHPRFEVEWVTVSYRAILRGAGVIVAVVLVAGGILLWKHLEETAQRQEVERIVAQAERELGGARDQGVAEDVLAPIGKLLDRARAELDGGRLENGRAEAEKARDEIRRIGQVEKARLLRVEGLVQIKRVGSREWITAAVGMPLEPGDLIRTGGGSAAQFVNPDGASVLLKHDALCKVERGKRDRVSGKTDLAVVVSTGELTLTTSGRDAEVTTPNLQATVQPDTRARVGVDEEAERSTIDVIEGSAVIRSGQNVVNLGGSERVSISPAGVERRLLPGVPIVLSPAMWKLLLSHELRSRPLEFEWESIRDARYYKVELAGSELFTNPVQVWNRHAATYVTPSALPLGQFFWRVTAIDRDGIEGGRSSTGVFRISDARPQGDPPHIEITSVENLGIGVYVFEGKTQPGVFLTLDDGEQTWVVEPDGSGRFSQVVSIRSEGVHQVTATARSSQGLEATDSRRVDVRE